MRNTVEIIVLLMCVGFIGCPSSQCRDQSELAALGVVTLSSQVPISSDNLSAIRQPQLEMTLQDVLTDQTVSHCFEITTDRTQDVGNRTIVLKSLDARQLWIVCVVGDRKYPLLGFTDPEKEFLRLVSENKLLIANKSQAAAIGEMYARVVLGKRYQEFSLSPLEAKQTMETLYYKQLNSVDQASKKANEWYTTFMTQNPGYTFRTIAEADGENFKVGIQYLYAVENEPPRFERLWLSVLRKGGTTAVKP